MIIVGLILLIVGFVAGYYVLWVIGGILLLLGLLLLLVGQSGHQVGSRKHYW
jgi:hypothetical protein